MPSAARSSSEDARFAQIKETCGNANRYQSSMMMDLGSLSSLLNH
jgi:hypothetical protein